MNLPDADDGNSEIERMWAQQRVSRLMGGERAGTAINRDEIVRLCEGYSIVSPYASMLVLENDAEYKRWKIEQRNVVRVSRDRKSRELVQSKLAELRQRAEEGFEVNRAEKLVSTQSPSDATRTQRPSVSQPTSEAIPQAVPERPTRGVDLDFSSGGGEAAAERLTRSPRSSR